MNRKTGELIEMPPKHTAPKTQLTTPDRIMSIVGLLDQHYPNARCTLNFSNPLELMVATILSAQCTDERVNQVTADLFLRYPTAESFARAPLEELETAIRPTGLFRNKAKSIREGCRILVEKFAGKVPRDLEALIQLPGIGRKTANVILGNAFHIAAGIAVDTHVARVARRLGLTAENHPAKIEQDLIRLIPANRWILFSHQLIQHGRRVCLAKHPKCSQCPLRQYSLYAQTRAHQE